MVRLLNISDEEWENRLNLAASYHLADYFGWSDIIWNHITAKTSKNKNTFLINKFGLRYDEVTASNLLEIDLEGNIIKGEGEINFTGFVIHGAIHQAKKEDELRGVVREINTIKAEMFEIKSLIKEIANRNGR